MLSERGAVLLDELRWLVLERELGGKLRIISVPVRSPMQQQFCRLMPPEGRNERPPERVPQMGDEVEGVASVLGEHRPESFSQGHAATSGPGGASRAPGPGGVESASAA